MTKNRGIFLLACLIMLGTLAFFSAPYLKQFLQKSTIQKMTDDIWADEAFAYATQPGAKTGAVFIAVHNNGKETDRLLGATAPGIAGIVELHDSYVDPDDGQMMMRKIPNVLLIGGYTIQLLPIGYHIMLIDMQKQLKVGDTFDIILHFEKAGDLKAKIEVIPPGTPIEYATFGIKEIENKGIPEEYQDNEYMEHEDHPEHEDYPE